MSEKENKEMECEVENTEKTVETSVDEETADNQADANEEATEKDPLEEANEQIAKLKDQLLRTMAEFENYKKRTLKEKTELILNGGEKTISAILPVLDDMERAIANADKADDINKLEEGWELIYKKFEGCLNSLGVKKIETENADFNTDYHEAVAMVPGMGDDKKGKVIDCVQTGYLLNEKVIRHAKVAVGQ
ncbi:MAG: nucleotide exchange factor GrpE [Prevotella sp.]|jgi:molecular chaperone GrpE|nr:nucleotide exchange factor GrpE [Prevotella sp.]